MSTIKTKERTLKTFKLITRLALISIMMFILKPLNVKAEEVFRYEYTGGGQTFTAPYNAYYTVELAGASGGICNSYAGGTANVIKVQVYMTAGQTLSFYCGGQGESAAPVLNQTVQVAGGYNGGGSSAIAATYWCRGPKDAYVFQGQSGQYEYDGDPFDAPKFYNYNCYNSSGIFVSGLHGYKINEKDCRHENTKPKYNIISTHGCFDGCKELDAFHHGDSKANGQYCTKNKWVDIYLKYVKNHRSAISGGGASGGGATTLYLDGLLVAGASGGGGAQHNANGINGSYGSISTSSFQVQGADTVGGAGGNYISYYNSTKASYLGASSYSGNGYVQVNYTIPTSNLTVIPFVKSENGNKTTLQNSYRQDKYAVRSANVLGVATYNGVATAQTFTMNVYTTMNILNPARLGYLFKGWKFTSPDGGFNPANSVYSAGYKDSTLEATWTPIKYKTNFIGVKTTGTVGGAPTPPSINNTYDELFNLSENTYKRDYTLNINYNEPLKPNSDKTSESVFCQGIFKGWTRVNNGDNTTNGNKVPVYSSDKSPVSVQYTDKQETVNLTELNNEQVNLYTVFELVSKKLPITTEDGYEFIGWNPKQDGSGEYNGKPGVTDTDRFGTHYPPDEDYTIKTDHTLYGQWKKKITLTFDLNGGKYLNNLNADKTTPITLQGTIYNDAPNYEFTIVNNQKTEENSLYKKTNPSIGYYWDTQVGTIDAYGKTDSETGKNTVYIKTDESGTPYRFLGWSLDKDAKEPDYKIQIQEGKDNIIEDSSKTLCSVHPDSKRASKLKVYSNTTLYAVWEPILTVTAMQYRALGDIGNINIKKVTVTYTKDKELHGELLTAVRSGEQVQYEMYTTNTPNTTLDVTFDNKLVNIYKIDRFKDNLNQITESNKSEIPDLENALSSLNRHIESIAPYVSRKFHMPAYLNEISDSENDVYYVDYVITRPSIYQTIVHGTPSVEQVKIRGYLYIGQIEDNGDYNPDIIDTVLNDLRTKLKIRLMNN